MKPSDSAAASTANQRAAWCARIQLDGATQELIEILPEDHPDYRQNAETIIAAMRRWNGGRSADRLTKLFLGGSVPFLITNQFDLPESLCAIMTGDIKLVEQ